MRELTSGANFGDRLFNPRRTATVNILQNYLIKLIFPKVIAFTPCDLLILDVKSDVEISQLFKDYLKAVTWRR